MDGYAARTDGQPELNDKSLGVCNPIEKHRQAMAGDFTQVSNELVRDGELSSDALRVYLLLLSHDDGYRESALKIAGRYGWGKNRAKGALRELVVSRLLIIQPYVTGRGTRAYEKYHVCGSGRFTDSDLRRLSETVGLVQNGPGGWSKTDQVLGLDQTNPLGPKQTNKEYKTKYKENTSENTRDVSNADAQDLIDTFSRAIHTDYQGDDPWEGNGERYEGPGE